MLSFPRINPFSIDGGDMADNDQATTQRNPENLLDRKVNPRVHDKGQMAKLKKSIREYGFKVPVLIDEHNVILAGHARCRAAVELGLASIPVVIATGWSEARKRAYVIADNRMTEISHWDIGELDRMVAALPPETGIEEFGFKVPEEEFTPEAVAPAAAEDIEEWQPVLRPEVAAVEPGAAAVGGPAADQMVPPVPAAVAPVGPAVVEVRPDEGGEPELEAPAGAGPGQDGAGAEAGPAVGLPVDSGDVPPAQPPASATRPVVEPDAWDRTLICPECGFSFPRPVREEEVA